MAVFDWIVTSHDFNIGCKVIRFAAGAAPIYLRCRMRISTSTDGASIAPLADACLPFSNAYDPLRPIFKFARNFSIHREIRDDE